ncbi:MAG: hypothetical protein C5B50_05445 [Verrucomicrobia bacterium]|nr:MAG: hypothetical protein C5B50_05445 [Verrucomicrobiota bacterium]
MRKIINLSIVALTLLCGCSGLQRPVADAALGAGGAYLGDKLSGGNPVAIAGGAAGGVLLSEGFQALKTSSEKRAYTNGYTLGRSDGVKQLYWNLQQQQRERPDATSVRQYQVTIPEHYEDGVLVQPATRILRIQE